MKFFKQLCVVLLTVFTLLFIVGCSSSAKVDISVMKGEDWVKLDKNTQTDTVEELIKSEGDKAKDHTAKYYVRQINSVFGASGTSGKLVKDIFKELAISGKTAEELSTVNGHSWKTMKKEEKLSILQQEVKDISDKNPAFKPKALDEYLKEMDEVFATDDERFLDQPVSETIQKVLTNNLIIHGQRIK